MKASERERDTETVSRFYFSTARFTPAGYTDAAGNVVTGSIVADYRAQSTADGRYAYGFFIDPAKLRAAADTLESRGLLSPATRADDRFRSPRRLIEHQGNDQRRLRPGPVHLGRAHRARRRARREIHQ